MRHAPRAEGSRLSSRRGWGLLALLLVVSACSSGASQEDLSLACEMHKCDCAPDSSSFDPGVPVLWQQDGSATCPKAHHLRVLDQPPSSKMVT
jgi:hypothetical protein